MEEQPRPSMGSQAAVTFASGSCELAAASLEERRRKTLSIPPEVPGLTDLVGMRWEARWRRC